MDRLYDFLREETYVPMFYRSRTFEIARDKLSEYFVMIKSISGLETPYLTDLGSRAVEDYMAMTKGTDDNVLVPSFAQVMSMFKPIPQKVLIKISNYKQALSVGRLRSYFGDEDILNLSQDLHARDDYEFVYGGDYYEYVFSLNLDKKDIVQRYMQYLKRIAIKSENIDYTTFNGGGVARSIKQLEEYEAILIPGYSYILPSDGYGIGSCYCILNDIPYKSSEPNAIGKIARELGIITSINPLYTNHDYYRSRLLFFQRLVGYEGCDRDRYFRILDFYENKLLSKRQFLVDIYAYMYCCQYYKIPEIPRQKYIILDVPTIKLYGTYKCGCRVSSNSAEIIKERELMIDRSIYKRKQLDYKNAYVLDAVSRVFCENSKIPIVTEIDDAVVILSMSKGAIYNFSKREKRAFVLSKVFFIPTWTYPFKQGSKYVFGKMYGKEMYTNYGKGEYFYDKEYKNISSEVEEDVEYVMVDQIFAIPGSRNTPIRSLRLRPVDRVRFNGQAIIQVYMLSSLSVGGIVYGMYAERSNTDPHTVIK